ncbi:hypothetical protein [Pseudofulvibacter geojedonensis]|uniref:Lipoprotein n=1 Tax=Pseudofulvibacter geojedonensis TaxID=1123758 RepID=A0ABW3I4P2_9FLAO
MKNLKKVVMLVMFATVFFSCTTDDVIMNEPQKEMEVEINDEVARDTGGDEEVENDDDE